MHGLSREDRGAFKQYSEKQSSLIITHQFYLCYIFYECIVKNYCVKCEILGWEFLELKCQLYQAKLKYQLKSWNLE